MISQAVYHHYLHHLLQGDKNACINVVDQLIADAVPVDEIYVSLFHLISVATEHLATAITELIMIRCQPQLFSKQRVGRKAVICSVANEYHQVGAKMVADTFEWKGWDGYYLGANTPGKDLIRFLDVHRPDILGLSLSLYFNLPSLKNILGEVRRQHPSIPVIVGGQAFRWGGQEIIQEFNNTFLIGNIIELQKFIKSFQGNGEARH